MATLLSITALMGVWRSGVFTAQADVGAAGAAHERVSEGERGERSVASVGGQIADDSRKRPPPAPGRPGQLTAVPGRSEVSGPGTVHRFVVEVEGGLLVDPKGFAREVERTLFHSRGWAGTGRIAFQRVRGGRVDFRVTLATAWTTDRLCAPLQTRGSFSCYMDGRAVLNFARWSEGARSYGADLKGYRRYMINHEVGHALGHGHAGCPVSGRRAPVMMQQTKGVGACRPNPWPLEAERGAD